MSRINAWMLVAGLAICLSVGCAEKREPAVVQEPPAKGPILIFPEDQVPSPEPQPCSPKVASPPVDTSATKSCTFAGVVAKPLPKESYAPVQKKAGRSYVVRKGDTLQKISSKHYKTTKKWRRIYQANKNVLTEGPDHLSVGMKLVIP